MIHIYILAFIGVVLLVFIGYDLVKGIYLWEKRIHIGRWNDLDEWECSVSDVVKKWLIHTPVVKKTDQSRYLLWDKLRGEYKVDTIQIWQEAGLLWGVEMMKDTPKIKSYLFKVFDYTHGGWNKKPQNIDAGLLGYVVLQFADKNEIQLLKPAMDYLYQLILSHKDKDTICYRKSLSYVRFVDTLGFICPFLILYGVMYNLKDAIDLGIRQLEEYDIALLPNGIPCHAFAIEKNLPLGVYDWGRGCGWYILALVESYRMVDRFNISQSLQRKLQSRILNLSEVMLSFQLSQGGYNAMLFSRNGSSESSITVFGGILMCQAWIFTKKEGYKLCLEGCIKQLMKATQRNGCIDYCQGDTKGIGAYSFLYSYMPFVQGMTLVLLKRYKEINEDA